VSGARATHRLALAAALLSVAAPAVAAPAGAAARHDVLALTVDGVALRAPALARGAEQPLVPLDAVGAALGWRVVPLAGGARVSDQDRTIVVSVGSRLVREDGDARTLFAAPPLDRHGRLFLTAADAARLFGARVALAHGTVAFVRPVRLSAPMRVAELPRPASPRPSPTPRPVQARTAEGDPLGPGAGRLVVSLDRVGSTRLLQFASQTSSAGLQTSVSAAGVDRLGALGATVVLGSPARGVGLGLLPDPLGGAILRGSGFTGIVAGAGRETLFAGRRLDGETELGAMLADPFGGGATTLAVLGRDGAYDQTIVRRSSHRHQPWGDFGSELMIGERGLGVGVSARTRGRTFVESSVAYATPGLPIGPDDAPISVDLGRHLSPATTLVGGAETGPRQPLAPFFGLSSGSGALLGSVFVSERALTASASYQTGAANLQFFTVPGPQRASGFSGALFLPAATLEASWTSALDARDASLTLRTVRRGLNLIAGAGLPSGGRLGPIVGASVPAGSGLALEGTVRPAGGGQTALRLALAVGIPGRRAARVPTVPAAVLVVNGPADGAMQLYVDGVPVRRFSGARTTVEVARGAHAFAVRSGDGRLGSPDATVTVGAAGDPVELVVWPERAVRGRVVAADTRSLGADFSLAGITVTIEPGGLTAQTDADGTFVFARRPFGPETSIGIDPSSLPRELRAPAREPLAEGDIRLELDPALRIERQTFPSRRAASP
jgi:hypothetical protein